MDILGLILGFALVFASIGTSSLLLKSQHISETTSRKLIHILVSHWILIAWLMISNVWIAMIAPVVFIILNTLAYFKGVKALGTRNLGTIYFPIILLILVALSWSGVFPIWMTVMSILLLGWSDGLAALVGIKTRFLEFKIFGHTKSVAGVLTMLISSFIVGLFFINPLLALIVAVIATIIELITPFGMDNLTVPLAVVLVVLLF